MKWLSYEIPEIRPKEITYMSVATKLAELDNKFSLCNANKSKQIESKNEDTFIKQKHSQHVEEVNDHQ